MRRALLIVVLGTVVAIPGVVRGEWRHLLTGMPGAMVVDRRGDVLTTIGKRSGPLLTRFAGETGRVRWRRRSPVYSRASTMTSEGDVIVGGVSSSTGDRRGNDAGVARHGGGNGALRWRWRVDGSNRGRFDLSGFVSSFDGIDTVALDDAGDVIAAGAIDDRATLVDVLVVKLDGLAGRELWRMHRANPGDHEGVSGMVLASGGHPTLLSFDSSGLTLQQLDGEHGGPRWTRGLAVGEVAGAARLAAAPGNHAVVLAPIDGQITAVGIDLADGHERWRRAMVPNDGGGVTRWVDVTPSGDVVVGVTVASNRDLISFLAGLDGDTGTERWRILAGDAAMERLDPIALGRDGVLWVRSREASDAPHLIEIDPHTGQVRAWHDVDAVEVVEDASGHPVAGVVVSGMRIRDGRGLGFYLRRIGELARK